MRSAIGDHGYNGAPFFSWVSGLAANGITRLFPLSYEVATVLPLLDVAIVYRCGVPGVPAGDHPGVGPGWFNAVSEMILIVNPPTPAVTLTPSRSSRSQPVVAPADPPGNPGCAGLR